MIDSVKSFKELEAKILQTCKGESYLFRGATKRYSEGKDSKAERGKEIDSSLYRWAVGENFVFYEKYRPFNMEKEIVERAKKHFPDRTSNIEVLTDLQHYGGKTNLIDFSRNLYKALFFACDGDFEKDGELICLKSSMTMKKDINYAYLENTLSPFIIEPAGTQTSQRRVIAQDSVFVYPREGFLDKSLLKIIPVPFNLKKDILRHLKEFHNIDTDTIYNDLMGFITNEKNYETAAIHFYKGLALNKEGNHEEAINKYNEAIELNPKDADTYYNRGLSKAKLEQYQNAIKDYNKAIELNPKNAGAYNNRGNSKAKLEQYQNAIKDYNKAIELNPKDAGAYNNRGRSKHALGKYQDAINDYDKAIELNPKYADAYYNRGNSKHRLEQHQDAIKDYDQAIKLNLDYAKAYDNRGRSKAELGDYEEAIKNLEAAKGLFESEENMPMVKKLEELIQEYKDKLNEDDPPFI